MDLRVKVGGNKGRTRHKGQVQREEEAKGLVTRRERETKGPRHTV